MRSAKRLEQTGAWSSITSSLSSIPEGSRILKSTFDLKNNHHIQILFRWLTIILEFLNLPWEDAVLHHEEQINKPGGVRLFNLVSNVEKWDVEPLAKQSIMFFQGEGVHGGAVQRPDHQAHQPRRLDHLGGHLPRGGFLPCVVP